MEPTAEISAPPKEAVVKETKIKILESKTLVPDKSGQVREVYQITGPKNEPISICFVRNWEPGNVAFEDPKILSRNTDIKSLYATAVEISGREISPDLTERLRNLDAIVAKNLLGPDGQIIKTFPDGTGDNFITTEGQALVLAFYTTTEPSQQKLILDELDRLAKITAKSNNLHQQWKAEIHAFDQTEHDRLSQHFPDLGLKVEDLVGVRCVDVDSFPEIKPDGKVTIPSLSDRTDIQRQTVHWTLNHPVMPNNGGNWEDLPMVIMTDVKSAIAKNGEPYGFNGNDTFWAANPGEGMELDPQRTTLAITPELQNRFKDKLDQLAQLGMKIIVSNNPRSVVPSELRNNSKPYIQEGTNHGVLNADGTWYDKDPSINSYLADVRRLATETGGMYGDHLGMMNTPPFKAQVADGCVEIIEEALRKRKTELQRYDSRDYPMQESERLSDAIFLFADDFFNDTPLNIKPTTTPLELNIKMEDLSLRDLFTLRRNSQDDTHDITEIDKRILTKLPDRVGVKGLITHFLKEMADNLQYIPPQTKRSLAYKGRI